MLVNNNSTPLQFGMALKLGALCENGKSKIQKCFPADYHYLELHKTSISQIDNPYDVVVLPLKSGSKKVKAQIIKPAVNKETLSVVLATIYPRKSLLSRANENMSVVKRACEMANSFNVVV